jgi:hypothetical protein
MKTGGAGANAYWILVHSQLYIRSLQVRLLITTFPSVSSSNPSLLRLFPHPGFSITTFIDGRPEISVILQIVSGRSLSFRASWRAIIWAWGAFSIPFCVPSSILSGQFRNSESWVRRTSGNDLQGSLFPVSILWDSFLRVSPHCYPMYCIAAHWVLKVVSFWLRLVSRLFVFFESVLGSWRKNVNPRCWAGYS